GEPPPQEDALKAFAAVPAVLPRDGARAVPHQEIHGARIRRYLIFDDAVVAVQRSRRLAEHGAADRKRALSLDHDHRRVVRGVRAADREQRCRGGQPGRAMAAAPKGGERRSRGAPVLVVAHESPRDRCSWFAVARRLAGSAATRHTPRLATLVETARLVYLSGTTTGQRYDYGAVVGPERRIRRRSPQGCSRLPSRHSLEREPRGGHGRRSGARLR